MEHCYDGVYAQKNIPLDQLFGRLYYIAIPLEIYLKAYQAPRLRSMLKIFDGHYIFIPRFPHGVFSDHPANFIRNSSHSANCRLVWGRKGHYEACIFLQAIKRVRRGEELFLESGGIDSMDEVTLRACLSPPPTPRSVDNVEESGAQLESRAEKICAKCSKLAFDMKDKPPGFWLACSGVPDNVPDVDEFLERNAQPTREDVEAFLREKFSFEILLTYDAMPHYHKTSPNGMCFFNAYYQAAHRCKDPTSFLGIAPFPICSEYLKRYGQVLRIADMHEVFCDNFNRGMITAAFENVNANMRDLCDGKKAGFEFGNLSDFAGVQAMFPIEKDPNLVFSIFERIQEGEHLQLYVMTASLLHSASLGNKFDTLGVKMAIRNVVFFADKHFWLPTDKDLNPVSWSVEEMFERFVDEFMELLKDI